ncbi:hypothetical protein VV867_17485 [Pseudomonas sp. JH-2]|uniref:DUF7281 domain-containing protein n=1 Tax=Pseudomonas sp. JH-2 TaxID=3114998 RepID=UPI002E265C68|nr:hypothetical protein [Pseudomonas sp. JH-2]
MIKPGDIRAIADAVAFVKDYVPANKLWKRLNAQYEIGTKQGARFSLTAADHKYLRDLVRNEYGFDLLKERPLDGELDRMSLAQKTRSEKLSGEEVSRDIILVGSGCGVLSLPEGDFTLPTGAVLQLQASALHGAEQVVLVENLSPMYHLHHYLWPVGMSRTPMIFRGSPQYSPAAVAKALAGVRRVICFPDFDPQGLLNSFCTDKADGLVIPTKKTRSELICRRLDKPHDFTRQVEARDWLRKQRLGLEYVSDLLASETGFSQESMVGLDLQVADIA